MLHVPTTPVQGMPSQKALRLDSSCQPAARPSLAVRMLVQVWDFAQCISTSTLAGHGGDVKACDWHPRQVCLSWGLALYGCLQPVLVHGHWRCS